MTKWTLETVAWVWEEGDQDELFRVLAGRPSGHFTPIVGSFTVSFVMVTQDSYQLLPLHPPYQYH